MVVETFFRDISRRGLKAEARPYRDDRCLPRRSRGGQRRAASATIATGGREQTLEDETTEHQRELTEQLARLLCRTDKALP
jgi:hypothetical protein